VLVFDIERCRLEHFAGTRVLRQLLLFSRELRSRDLRANDQMYGNPSPIVVRLLLVDVRPHCLASFRFESPDAFPLWTGSAGNLVQKKLARELADIALISMPSGNHVQTLCRNLV
jgi:hypothetical protein